MDKIREKLNQYKKYVSLTECQQQTNKDYENKKIVLACAGTIFMF